jgi:hypothetical protein
MPDGIFKDKKLLKVYEKGLLRDSFLSKDRGYHRNHSQAFKIITDTMDITVITIIKAITDTMDLTVKF